MSSPAPGLVSQLVEPPPGPPSEEADGVGVELSVVMPCLNEARTVGRCVTKALACLDRLGIRGEVVVADNGSTDGSPAIAAAHGARVVRVAEKGYGSALQGGIRAARGRYVVMGDADDSYDFALLDPFVERLRAGDDVVMGNRFKGGIRPGAMPWHHKYIGNPALTAIMNLFFRSSIGDSQCGLRAFRKDAYVQLGLCTPGMEFASEMVVKAALQGHRIGEVPVVLHPDGRDRPPHLRSFRDGWRHLRFLLLMCPLWLYMIPAGFLLTVGIGLLVWLTPGPRPVGSVVLDIHPMFAAASSVILGYQVIWLWAFARIYGWKSGLLPRETFSAGVFRHLNLERGVTAGLVLALVGAGLHLDLVYLWYLRDFGAMEVATTLRMALWGLLALVLGGQTVFGSFFLSMLGLLTPSAGGSRPAH